MDRVHAIIHEAGQAFRERLERMEREGGLTRERYIRYLTMQYHLTKGVQRHFMNCASHPDLASRKPLREFLFNFAIEEEPHYRIAQKDLEHLGQEPGECPLDVELWWAYFSSVVTEHPFIRLGATCILENIADPSHDVIDRLFQRADYLTPLNTKFITIHRHGPNLAHGAEILQALTDARLEPHQLRDVEKGARTGATIYLRLADWALGAGDTAFRRAA